jgi:hypothetical protein
MGLSYDTAIVDRTVKTLFWRESAISSDVCMVRRCVFMIQLNTPSIQLVETGENGAIFCPQKGQEDSIMTLGGRDPTPSMASRLR